MSFKALQLVFLIGMFFTSHSAFAAQELVFHQQTKVYSQRNTKSDILTYYDKSDRVPVSKENYGAWKKIVAEVDGKKKLGWVLVRDLKGAKLREKNEEVVTTPSGQRKKVNPIYRKRTGMGFSGVLSYYKQGGGEEALAGTTTQMKFSDLDGTAAYFSIFGDFVLSSRLNLRTYLSLRNLERSGEAVYPPGTDTRSTSVEQNGLSVGATLKLYSHTDSNTWWGGGAELVKTSQSDVTATNVTAAYKDDPLYIFVHAAAGYDLNIVKDIFILPEFRLGVAVNGSPLIINAEILIPIAYRF